MTILRFSNCIPTAEQLSTVEHGLGFYVAKARIAGLVALGLVATAALLAPALWAAPTSVSFSQSATAVEAYDFLEVTARLASPDARNPFTDATLTGWFGKSGGAEHISTEGFCNTADGTEFRIRFMPSTPGDYKYSVTYRQRDFEKTYGGAFRATDGRRRGPIRIDPKYPWHFIWEGTGEHYFFNGTTAYWLAGFPEERVIHYSIERLRQLKVNRLRVLLSGSQSSFWGEPIYRGNNFTMLRPWLAENPESVERPGIDYTRFNVPYWQKWERMLQFARERDMIISVVFYWEGDIDPIRKERAGSEDERRYFRYAAARLSAFSNITWDLGDDLDTYRDEKWTRETGTLLMKWDPYRHLATTHPVRAKHQDRASEWFGFTSIQEWSRRQHQVMLEQRQIQLKTGRIIPQTNEEYGYEDHYPRWAPEPPGNSAEVLRRVAWDIAMAGAYGTTGESARRGFNVWPDTGGGWFNGRGDDTMIMLKGYAHMVDFFTSFDWWKTEPHDELVNSGAYCLAKPGEIYAVYLPVRPSCGNPAILTYESECSPVTIKLEPGSYDATWFSAFTGETVPLAALQIQESAWTLPRPPGWLDWALLLKRSQ